MSGTNIHEAGPGRYAGVETPTNDDHAANQGYVKAYVAAHAGGTISVTDGTHTVTGLTELDFTSGATVTDAGGGVAQVAVAGGGSQPFDVVRETLAFDTPDILTGVVIDTPSDGDLLIGALTGVSVTTAFDGTFPNMHVLTQGGTPGSDDLTGNSSMSQVDPPGPLGTTAPTLAANSSTDYRFDGSAPVIALLDDSSGGDPGSMQGECEIVLLIARAS